MKIDAHEKILILTFYVTGFILLACFDPVLAVGFLCIEAAREGRKHE